MSLKPMCKITQKSNMIEKCEPDDIILLIPAKKAQYYYFSMACGLIFTMLMMAFTDFFSLYFLFVPQSNLKLSTCSSQATARICL